MASWLLTGNALGASTTSRLGTTDSTALVIETDGKERVRVEASGNVGIGTSTPAAPLDVRSGARIATLYATTNANNWVEVGNTVTHLNIGVGATAPTAGVPYVWSASNNFMIGSDGAPTFFVQGMSNGSVGIGTTSPQKPLDVAASGGIRIGQTAQAAHTNEIYFADNGQIRSLDDNHRIIFNRSNNDLELREFGTITFSSAATTGQRMAQMVLGTDGNLYVSNKIGIGLDQNDIERGGEPSSPLVVHGNVEVIDNGNLSVSGDVLLTGADCAEDFDVAGDDMPDPGTVVIIDEGGALRESREAYDRKVAGVVSGGGDFRHGLVLDKRDSESNRIPVALAGKVYCKVDARYSPVEVGDLLTTSHTPGHAMKAAEPKQAFGSVIGKALRPLKSGQALIPILIALQ
jgi:hypothetical protein